MYITWRHLQFNWSIVEQEIILVIRQDYSFINLFKNRNKYGFNIA